MILRGAQWALVVVVVVTTCSCAGKTRPPSETRTEARDLDAGADVEDHAARALESPTASMTQSIENSATTRAGAAPLSLATPCALKAVVLQSPWNDVSSLVRQRPKDGTHVRVVGQIEHSGGTRVLSSVCRSVKDDTNVNIVFSDDACIRDGDIVMLEAAIAPLSLISQMTALDGADFELVSAHALGTVPVAGLCRHRGAR